MENKDFEALQRRVTNRLHQNSEGTNLGVSRMVELAKEAVASSFSLEDSVELLRWHQHMRKPMSRSLTEKGLSKLVGVLGEEANSVLEYLAYPSFFTSGLLGRETLELNLVIHKDLELYESMSELDLGANTSLTLGLESKRSCEKYQLIVCSPPWGVSKGGRKPTSGRAPDGFGGELVVDMLEYLDDNGELLWCTARSLLFNASARKTIDYMASKGFEIRAVVELASGFFANTSLSGVALCVSRSSSSKVFLGALSADDQADDLATAYRVSKYKKASPSWQWVDEYSGKTFRDLENERALKRMLPQGKFSLETIGSLLVGDHKKILKADKEPPEAESHAEYLYVPEYPGSKVTSELSEQTVKEKAVYRLPLDPERAKSKFLVSILNSPYGRQIRANYATGANLPRIRAVDLLSLQVPLPTLSQQDRLISIRSDINLLRNKLSELEHQLDSKWALVDDVEQEVGEIKRVVDLESRISNWWGELPYPLAAVYRRYQVSADPKEQFESLLHFFELTALYLANMATSHLKLMSENWSDTAAKIFNPPKLAGISRADFGFWINLTGQAIKELKRIASSPDKAKYAVSAAGLSIFNNIEVLAESSKVIDSLNVARKLRNNVRGHGGLQKSTDAERHCRELEIPLRNLYGILGPLYREIYLVKTGTADVRDEYFIYQAELLKSSDPTFMKTEIQLTKSIATNSLAFWRRESGAMCKALPLFRLGASQSPPETSFYVYNKVVESGVRFVSYQEAKEQELTLQDSELENFLSEIQAAS